MCLFVKFLLFQWIKFSPTGTQPCFCPYDMHSIKQATAFIQASYYSLTYLIICRLTCNQVVPCYICTCTFSIGSHNMQFLVCPCCWMQQVLLFECLTSWKNNSLRRYRNLYLLKLNWKIIDRTMSLCYNIYLVVDMVKIRGRGSFHF